MKYFYIYPIWTPANVCRETLKQPISFRYFPKFMKEKGGFLKKMIYRLFLKKMIYRLFVH